MHGGLDMSVLRVHYTGFSKLGVQPPMKSLPFLQLVFFVVFRDSGLLSSERRRVRLAMEDAR